MLKPIVFCGCNSVQQMGGWKDLKSIWISNWATVMDNHNKQRAERVI